MKTKIFNLRSGIELAKDIVKLMIVYDYEA